MTLDPADRDYDAWQDAIREERNRHAWDGLRCRCGEGCAPGRCQFTEDDEENDDADL